MDLQHGMVLSDEMIISKIHIIGRELIKVLQLEENKIEIAGLKQKIIEMGDSL